MQDEFGTLAVTNRLSYCLVFSLGAALIDSDLSLVTSLPPLFEGVARSRSQNTVASDSSISRGQAEQMDGSLKYHGKARHPTTPQSPHNLVPYTLLCTQATSDVFWSCLTFSIKKKFEKWGPENPDINAQDLP